MNVKYLLFNSVLLLIVSLLNLSGYGSHFSISIGLVLIVLQLFLFHKFIKEGL